MENKESFREMKFRNRKLDKIVGILNIIVSVVLIIFVGKVITTRVDSINIFFVILDILGAILFIIVGIVDVNKKNIIYIKLCKDKIFFNNGIIKKCVLELNKVTQVEKVLINGKFKMIKLHVGSKEEFSFVLDQLETDDEEFFCDFINKKFRKITTTKITKRKFS